MSDTPRTDHLATRRAYAIGRGDLAVCWKEMADHARQLERELNQARNDCDGLMLTVQELRHKISTLKTDP